MANVKFVSYAGEYPNLCSGVLTVEIDGKPISFGWPWNKGPKPDYPPFWVSGGNATVDDDYDEHVSCGEWQMQDYGFNPAYYPKEIFDLLPDILKVMNENTKYGCCGGCL